MLKGGKERGEDRGSILVGEKNEDDRRSRHERKENEN
jgi:hypothetical protein